MKRTAADEARRYYTYTRSAAYPGKVRDRGGLTLGQAQTRCADFNHNRTVAQSLRGIVMDFSRE